MIKNLIDKVAWVQIQDGKLLMTLSRGKDLWYIPGGQREAEESDADTLAREIKEELDVNIDKTTLKHFGTYEAQAHSRPEGMFVRITCYFAEFKGRLKPSMEIAEYKYFTYDMRNLSSLVDHQLFDELKAKNFIK